MKRIVALLLLSFVYLAQANNVNSFYETVQKIIQHAKNNTQGYQRLTYMCDQFGSRFSGSQSLENAIDWILATMKLDGLQNVEGERVVVPKWVRGEATLKLTKPRDQKLAVLALGQSISTPVGGLSGYGLVVNNFTQLDDYAKKNMTQGKIIIYNVPFTSYGETVQYRTEGATQAAKVGAIASLTRSVTPKSLYTPHTGQQSSTSIPAASITVEDAELLQRFQDSGQPIILHLEMNCYNDGNAISRNVIAEIKGTQYPEQIVVIGGHIDSWDVGTGAHDDGGGCVMAWQTLNLLNAMGLRPKRTIRAVLFTNEENGGKGAQTYLNDHLWQINDTVWAFESDSGSFYPRGLSFDGTQEAKDQVQEIANLLLPELKLDVVVGGAGADVGPLCANGVPGAGLQVYGYGDTDANLHNEDNEYFQYHHSNSDTIDKVKINEFNMCLATMASTAYVIASMDDNLPRK